MRIIAGILTDSSIDRSYVTIHQQSRVYIGSTSNTLAIFESQGCKEIAIINIDSKLAEQSLDRISRCISTSLLPVAYGGGILNYDQAIFLASCGVERLIFGSSIFENINLISLCSSSLGAQSVCLSIDISIDNNNFPFVAHRKSSRYYPLGDVLRQIELLEIGELLVTFTQHNSLSSATLPLSLIKQIRDKFCGQLVIAGGIKRIDDLSSLNQIGVDGVLLSSHICLHFSYAGVCIDFNRPLQ